MVEDAVGRLLELVVCALAPCLELSDGTLHGTLSLCARMLQCRIAVGVRLLEADRERLVRRRKCRAARLRQLVALLAVLANLRVEVDGELLRTLPRCALHAGQRTAAPCVMRAHERAQPCGGLCDQIAPRNVVRAVVVAAGCHARQRQ